MIVSVVYLQASSRVHELHELHPIGKPIYNKHISQSEMKRRAARVFSKPSSPRLPRSDIFNASPILPRSLEGTSFTYSTRVGGHWQPRIIDGIALCRILQKYRQEGSEPPPHLVMPCFCSFFLLWNQHILIFPFMPTDPLQKASPTANSADLHCQLPYMRWAILCNLQLLRSTPHTKPQNPQ